MALRKRKIKRRSKVRPKLTHFQLWCQDTSNRLQGATDCFAINAIYRSNKDMKPVELRHEQLLPRFDSTITTLQMNYPDHVSYRVQLTWSDRKAKPRYGHLFPSMTVVKTSRYLWLSVTLAYLELCKRANKLL